MKILLAILFIPAVAMAQVDLSSSSQVKNVLRVVNGGLGTATFGAFTLFGNNTNATAAPATISMDTLFGSCSGANSALTYSTSTHLFGCNTITPGTGTVTSLTFSAPLTGGTITTSGTVGIGQATTSTDGYLSSTDWNTFNGKQPAGSYALQSTTLTASSPLTGGGDLSTNRSFGCQAASASQAGCLSSTDWSTFNGKGAGSVTSIATTSPITGGTITGTGTIACATCVVASSPGAGIARFAGSTQTVTSSELSGDATTSGSNVVSVVKVNGSTPGGTCTAQFVRSLNSSAVPTCQPIVGADLPAPTSSALGGVISLPVFVWTSGIGTAATTAISTNQIGLASFYVPWPTGTITKIVVDVTTADTGSSYDVGTFGPGCLNGATNVPLAYHVGNFTFAAGTGTKALSLSASGVLAAGWYCFAYTSGSATPTVVLGGPNSTLQQQVVMFGNNTKISGGGSALPSTITAPALNELSTSLTFVSFF